jgi:PPOX class probable F420-dependent enzyme
VAVTFAAEGDAICAAVDQKPKSGANLKRLRNAGENPWVTTLADRYWDDWDTLWWVHADGKAAITADRRQMAAPPRPRASRHRQDRQAPPADPGPAVTVGRWSGWAPGPTA